jgi:ATP-binding cassette subfamily F protein uup
LPLLANCGRAFLDNVVTSVLAPVSGAKWKEYAGGYTDWQRQRPAAAVQDKPAAKAPAHEKTPAKLTYKEQRELEALPGEIEGELVGELER